MKANRKFIQADERAVSAVIGVILMVAVAVAMAATAFAYFTGIIGGSTETAPVMDFAMDNIVNTLTFVYSDTEVTWEELQVLAEDETSFQVDLASGKTGKANVGEKLFINGKGLTGTTIVTIVHVSSQTVMGDYTFTNVTP